MSAQMVNVHLLSLIPKGQRFPLTSDKGLRFSHKIFPNCQMDLDQQRPAPKAQRDRHELICGFILKHSPCSAVTRLLCQAVSAWLPSDWKTALLWDPPHPPSPGGALLSTPRLQIAEEQVSAPTVRCNK